MTPRAGVSLSRDPPRHQLTGFNLRTHPFCSIAKEWRKGHNLTPSGYEAPSRPALSGHNLPRLSPISLFGRILRTSGEKK